MLPGILCTGKLKITLVNFALPVLSYSESIYKRFTFVSDLFRRPKSTSEAEFARLQPNYKCRQVFTDKKETSPTQYICSELNHGLKGTYSASDL